VPPGLSSLGQQRIAAILSSAGLGVNGVRTVLVAGGLVRSDALDVDVTTTGPLAPKGRLTLREEGGRDHRMAFAVRYLPTMPPAALFGQQQQQGKGKGKKKKKPAAAAAGATSQQQQQRGPDPPPAPAAPAAAGAAATQQRAGASTSGRDGAIPKRDRPASCHPTPEKPLDGVPAPTGEQESRKRAALDFTAALSELPPSAHGGLAGDAAGTSGTGEGQVKVLPSLIELGAGGWKELEKQQEMSVQTLLGEMRELRKAWKAVGMG
jgi:hypothetical protein